MIDSTNPNTSEEQLHQLQEELAALKQKCDFLERVVHEVPASIYISDLKRGVLWCNKTNEQTLGYTLDEILKIGGMEYIYKVVHPDDYTVPDNSLTHYQRFNGAEYGGIFRAKHKNETHYKWFVGWAKSFTKDKEDHIKEIICVDVDMSPHMNTENQLIEALRENLKMKNKLLIKSLRTREVEILSLICGGASTKTIAEKLHLSTHTVSTHRRNIQHKLGTSNVADMVSIAKEAGLG